MKILHLYELTRSQLAKMRLAFKPRLEDLNNSESEIQRNFYRNIDTTDERKKERNWIKKFQIGTNLCNL